MTGPTIDGTGAWSLLRDLVATPSPSGAERAAAELLVDRMTAAGFRAGVDACGNAVGEIGTGRGPDILLLGHLDTVAGPIPVTDTGATLTGRGAVDAKGPLAAMVAAAADPSFPGRLRVVGAVEEETSTSRGARHLLATAERPDAVIVGEPNGAAGIGTGYRGRIAFDVELARPAAHSSAPTPKAAEAVVDLYAAVRAHLAATTGGPRLFDQATATLLTIHGDLTHARASVSCRVPVGFDSAAFVGFLRDLDPTATVDVRECTEAVRCDGADPVVRALGRAIRAHGFRPTWKLKTGTCDLNVVAPVWRVPAAVYGPGDSRLDHTDDERIEADEFHTAIAILRHALRDLAGDYLAGP